MKNINIPADLTLSASSQEAEPPKFSFRTYVTYLLDSNPVFNESGSGLRASVRIDTAAKKAGDVMSLADEDWALLREASESPKVRDRDGQIVTRYPIHPSRALLPFLDAIATAKEV